MSFNKITLEEIENAEIKPDRLEVKHLSEFSEIMKKLISSPREAFEGYPTKRWLGFNRSFGGARSELVTITGESGRGKTTFALNWLMDTAEQNRKCFLMALEGGPVPATEALSRLILHENIFRVSEESREEYFNTAKNLPIWVLDHSGSLKDRLVLKAIDYVCQELGINFILLDHLDYVDKDWQNRNKPEAYVIGDFVRGLAARAARHNCTIVLISHPSKLNSGDRTREITGDDLKGSSSIKQESGSVLSLFRPGSKNTDDVDVAWIRFWKIRSRAYSAAMGARIGYGFDDRSQWYSEIDGKECWGPVS